MFQQHYNYVSLLISDPKDRTVNLKQYNLWNILEAIPTYGHVGFTVVHKYTRVI